MATNNCDSPDCDVEKGWLCLGNRFFKPIFKSKDALVA